MRLRQRLIRPISALSTVVLLVLGLSIVDIGRAETESSAGAAEWVTAAEDELFALHNQHRADEGLPPLTRDTALDAVAREWTADMAINLGPSNSLAHRPNLAAAVEAGVTTEWQSIGENVGWTSQGAQWLHDAFVDSPGHRANIEGDYNRVGIGATYDADGHLYMTVNFLRGPALPATVPDAAPTGSADAWFADSAGVITTLGDVPHLGDMAGTRLNQPVVGMAATPSGNGYWMVATDGGIFTFGDAGFYGSTGNIRLNQPIVGMAATPSGKGYWLVAADGGIFTFGDAGFYGSTGNIRLNQPIVAIATTASGKGYWLLAADGGIFTFGDAGFHGSTGAMSLDAPVVAMASTPTGNGYWLVGADGAVYHFGDAQPLGSAAGTDAIGILATDGSSGQGYWVFTDDGQIVAFGSAGSGVVGSAPAGSDTAAIVPLAL